MTECSDQICLGEGNSVGAEHSEKGHLLLRCHGFKRKKKETEGRRRIAESVEQSTIQMKESYLKA